MKKPKTLKDLQNDPRVDQIWHEDEGGENNSSWWCYLKAGWSVRGNRQHAIHEATIKEVCDYVHTAEVWPDDPSL